MKKTIFTILLFMGIVLVSGISSAEIYKYIDNEGKVHFADVKPSGVASEQVDIQPINTAGGGSLKSATEASAAGDTVLSTASKYPKVELFVTSWCGYCKRAEAYLRKRGIPFTVYDIEKDLQAARRKDSLASRKGVPFALIGDQKLIGFSEAYYDRALQQAQ